MVLFVLSAQTRTLITLTLSLLLALLWAVISFSYGHTIPRAEVSLLDVCSEGLSTTIIFICFSFSTILWFEKRIPNSICIGFFLIFIAAFQDMLDELVILDGIFAPLLEDIGIPLGYLFLAAGLLKASQVFQNQSSSLLDSQARELRLCTVDQLTMLMNRRQFFKLSPDLLHNNVSAGKAVTALVLSIKDLEQINIDYGSTVGDRLLQKFATIIRKDLAHQHVSARLTGTHFVLLLLDTLPEEASHVAESIARATHAVAIENDHGDELVINLHINFGIADASAQDSIDSLLHRAHSISVRSAL